MRGALLFVISVLMASGCAGRTSSLLLERRVRGSLAEESKVGHAIAWRLEPVTQTQTQQGIEVYVNHASREYLKNFFSNRALFGAFAGTNPFFQEHLVFYVKVANRSGKKVFLNPAGFLLTDDHGNQYHVLGQDYISAFAESRQPIATVTRGVLEDASPGYFGLSLPVGKMLAAKPQGNFALLLQSALKTGPIFPGTVYDGLISFWNPSIEAKTVRLLVTDVTTDHGPDDVPRTSFDFTFEFALAAP